MAKKSNSKVATVVNLEIKKDQDPLAGEFFAYDKGKSKKKKKKNKSKIYDFRGNK